VSVLAAAAPVPALFHAQSAPEAAVPVGASGVPAAASPVVIAAGAASADTNSVIALKPVAKPASSKPATKPLTAFFKKPSPVTSNTETKASATSEVELLYSPEAAVSKASENGSTPADFDVFDRLVGTPSTTPFAKGREDASDDMEVVVDSADLFGASAEHVLDLSSLSPSPA
jgi:hypothetical protein